MEIDGARIHYLEKGAGPAIVMVHGLGGQSGNFAYGLVEKLANEFRVVVIDRPGAGYSTRESDESARLGGQAKQVADFIRALGLERPLVVGHSLGGAIALSVALDFPEAVRGAGAGGAADAIAGAGAGNVSPAGCEIAIFALGDGVDRGSADRDSEGTGDCEADFRAGESAGGFCDARRRAIELAAVELL